MYLSKWFMANELSPFVSIRIFIYQVLFLNYAGLHLWGH
ncbi:hypothetical protein VIBNISFn118_530022 [Vibrio nigripulchritudo SFn118]|nr:hypothetical protein VIBNISFn118_530022 [Vibrio nigripulchritudo SFn118]